ncbi:MAG TPA: squalene/phytoene synthase family protein [Acidimicrobiales bacterium]|jgi:phytoene synthase|nr:squalene/phytoene synthase family protein [Acidimicrobiales bacterium]
MTSTTGPVSSGPALPVDAVERAYRECEAITRREAKNFAYGIRLLHPPERRALSAVYALARRIDDIGDGVEPPEHKLEGLAGVRKQLGTLGEPTDDPVLLAVGDAKARYDLPMDAFGDLVDGCEMDVVGTTYSTIDDLVVYCRRVAGSIGRLSLAVFGAAHQPGANGLADDLGVALQLTNILRDVKEDGRRGRVYLPAADAVAHGCPADLSDDDALGRLVAFECTRAEDWFARGFGLLPLLDRRSQACVGAMAGIYHRLLRKIASDPMAVTRGRVSVPSSEKLWVAMSCLVSAGSSGTLTRLLGAP